MAGAAFGFEADSFFDETGNRANLGQLFLVIDPDALAGAESYAQRLEILIAAMNADEGVRLPGTRRQANRQKAWAIGIEIPTPLLHRLKQLADTAA